MAVADGTAERDDCRPDCGHGHFSGARVIATFTDPVQICGWYFWSRVLLHYPGVVPAGGKQDRF